VYRRNRERREAASPCHRSTPFGRLAPTWRRPAVPRLRTIAWTGWERLYVRAVFPAPEGFLQCVSAQNIGKIVEPIGKIVFALGKSPDPLEKVLNPLEKPADPLEKSANPLEKSFMQWV
jgi:hypothetical protein